MFPRFVFDAEKCYEGLEALKAYRRAWNETQKTWAEHPEHCGPSHAADALRTLRHGLSGEHAAAGAARDARTAAWQRMTLGGRR